MTPGPKRQRPQRRPWLLLLCLGALATGPAEAQRVAIRHYGVSDGLVQNQVQAILEDRRGFLWLGTWEGLSRFDGRRFVNYGVGDGLPHARINALAEDPQGRLWVGTQSGLAILVDEPQDTPARARAPRRSRFRAHRMGRGLESQVVALLFERDGTPWCLTWAGLQRGRQAQTGEWTFEMILPGVPRMDWTQAAMTDSQGRLWFGLVDRLVTVSAGRVGEHPTAPAQRGQQILGLLEPAPGRILVAYKHVLLEFSAGAWQTVPLDLEGNELIGPMQRDGNGTLFIGTYGGLVRLRDGRQRLYTTAHGLAQDFVGTLALDRDGHLWVGSGGKGGGVSRLAADGIESWTTGEGLPEPSVVRILEGQDGRVYASTEDSGFVEMGETAQPFVVEGSQELPFRDAANRIAQDRRGDWWIGTEEGLFRFSGPRLQLRSGRHFRAEDGISQEPISPGGVCADPAGFVWVGSADGKMYRFDPARTEPPFFDRIAISLSPHRDRVHALLVDRSGALWLSGLGGTARLQGGRLVPLAASNGLPAVDGNVFFQDRRGRFWIGLPYHGASATEDPDAPEPKWVNHSTRSGLGSDAVRCLAEDAAGRIYLGTSRGLDRLDVETGRVRHFTAHDGLPGDVVNDCMTDRSGQVWLALSGGVSKLDPQRERGASRPPPVYLTGVSVAGEDIPLPERGTARLSRLTLPASRNTLVVEYVAPSLGEGPIGYQYRLHGVDRDWSPTLTDPSVNFAHLNPGAYRLLVRAVNEDGVASSEPAVLEFAVEPPFWRRGWFVALVAAVITAAAFATHRARLLRAVALERVRTQIASDLHDELGSGLGSIGILAGLSADGDVAEPERRSLARKIADTASELGSALSDIVWTLRADASSLAALASHLAERGEGLFPGPIPAFATAFPPQWPTTPLPLSFRRNLLLVAVEALHNAAKHSQARRVVLGMVLEGRKLRLWVEDDGRGLLPDTLAAKERPGLGLTSMRRRTEGMGGRIAWRERPGGGTIVELVLDVGAGERHLT